MTGHDALRVLLLRKKTFLKMIAVERPALRLLRSKSRAVRMNSVSTTRTLWYQDRLRELNLAIDFLSGEMTEDEYVHFLLDDAAGVAAIAIGGM
jgi:hypothetical protein